MKPDAKDYNPDPDYIKSLIGSTKLAQKPLAKVLGINDRTLRRWISGEVAVSYADQFMLEAPVLSPDL